MMRRWKWPALEALVAFLAPSLFLASCVLIKVNPRDRLGQVSGIASLEMRFFLFSIVLVGCLGIAAHVREGRGFSRTARLVCAAAAGLASGLVAGGIMVALRGTPFGLHTPTGDVHAIVGWAQALQTGGDVPPMYPPLSLHMLATYSDLVGLSVEHGVKHLQIAGTLVFGPVAYLCWRAILKPGWALGIGVIAMLPLIEPYKPYPNLTLVAFVPMSIVMLRMVRDVEGKTVGQMVRGGIGVGLAFGAMFIMYSGWFKWAAPGLFVALLIVIPRRTALKPALALLAIMGAAFLLVGGRFIAALVLDPNAKILDTFVYFDVKVEPMYFAMWRNDLEGVVSTWPPYGELAGVGVFTILLAAGLGLAVTLGRKTLSVIALVPMIVGAFLLRFMHARLLWETKLVQLYPRTSALILYALLVLCGLALFWAIQRRPADSVLRGRGALIGSMCGLLLVFAAAGSSISDRYMPLESKPPGPGILSLHAHRAQWATKPKVYKATTLEWIRRSGIPAVH